MQEYIGGIPINSKKEDYRIELSTNINKELDETEYCSRSKVGREGVLRRQRILSNKDLTVMIIGFKTAIQREADDFFKRLTNSEFNIRKITKGAFSKARAKLNYEVFKNLNKVVVKTFYEKAPFHKWHNRRLVAVDGTRLVLPNHPSIKEEFGSTNYGPNKDSERTLAIASSLFDVQNLISIDAELAPIKSSELCLLRKHIEYMNQGDVLLLDRGYPCYWLFFLLIAKKIDFCVRLSSTWWTDVRDFTNSNDTERIITFTLPKKDFGKLAEYPQIRETEIQCRLVKVILDNGQTEILCTSLMDEKEFKTEEFKELYHLRWKEEEAFKLLKCRIEVEDFSGKTALAVKQDFYAKMFLLSLTAAYAHPIEEKVIKEFRADEKRKHNQKINRTCAIAQTVDIIMGVFLKKLYTSAMESFDDIVYKTREIIRPGRINPRNHRKKVSYAPNYKRL